MEDLIFCSFKTFHRIMINIFEYRDKQEHVLTWKGLF